MFLDPENPGLQITRRVSAPFMATDWLGTDVRPRETGRGEDEKMRRSGGEEKAKRNEVSENRRSAARNAMRVASYQAWPRTGRLPRRLRAIPRCTHNHQHEKRAANGKPATPRSQHAEAPSRPDRRPIGGGLDCRLGTTNSVVLRHATRRRGL